MSVEPNVLRVTPLPRGAGESSGGVWTLEEITQLIDRCVGGLDAEQHVRDRAYRRALALLDDQRAGDDTPRLAAIGFACDVLAELAVELVADLPSLEKLIQHLEAGARMSPIELGRELLRAPQLFRIRPTEGIEVGLKLLLAFTKADSVSLWRLSPAGQPEPVTSAGDAPISDVCARRTARRLLAGASLDDPLRCDTPGVLIDRAQENIALVARGGGVASACDLLLLEAAVPILAAAFACDERVGASPRAPELVMYRPGQTDVAERRLARIRFDLHDGPQQDLMLLAEDLRFFRSQLDSVLVGDETRERALGRFDDFEARLIALDADLRRISVSAESPFLHDESLPDALSEVIEVFAQRTGIEPQVRLRGDFSDLTDSQNITLLSLIREGLGNIREHAAAEHVTISLTSDADGVKATVTDDGRGFDPEAALVNAARGGHMGLVGMHERVRLLGGQTNIDSRPGGPTVISVSLPAWPRVTSTRQ